MLEATARRRRRVRRLPRALNALPAAVAEPSPRMPQPHMLLDRVQRTGPGEPPRTLGALESHAHGERLPQIGQSALRAVVQDPFEIFVQLTRPGARVGRVAHERTPFDTKLQLRIDGLAHAHRIGRIDGRGGGVVFLAEHTDELAGELITAVMSTQMQLRHVVQLANQQLQEVLQVCDSGVRHIEFDRGQTVHHQVQVRFVDLLGQPQWRCGGGAGDRMVTRSHFVGGAVDVQRVVRTDDDVSLVVGPNEAPASDLAQIQLHANGRCLQQLLDADAVDSECGEVGSAVVEAIVDAGGAGPTEFDAVDLLIFYGRELCGNGTTLICVRVLSSIGGLPSAYGLDH